MIRSSNRALIRQFWEFARPDRKGFYISFMLMFLTLVGEVARPFLLKQGISEMNEGDLAGLHRAGMLFLMVLILEYFWRSGFIYITNMAFLRTITRIRVAVFRHVIRLKMAFFDQQPVGRLLTRTTSDCESLSETLRAGISTIVVDLLTVVVIFGVLVKLDWGLSIAVLLTAPLVWLVVVWCGSRLREKFLQVRRALAEANGYMAEGIGGVEVLQLFQKQDWSVEKFRQTNKDYRRATIVSNLYDALLYAMIDGIAAIVTAVILFSAFNLQFGLVEVSTIVVYLNQIEKMFIPIRDFSGKFATFQQALAALQRIFDLLNNPQHIAQGTHHLEGDQLDVAFRKVRFRYQPEGPDVLKDIQFRVEPGQVIALVGQTGSGKSTIGKLLTRTYDGYQGEILVGGHELRTLNYHALRSKIAVVHQDVELFPGTLRENISMFNPNIDDEKIQWAIRLVKAEHLVEDLPGGLDHQVREDGGNLSAGQTQLIVFARALAHDAPIILMDEATSSVDSVTEAWIQEAIFQIFKHKTVLIVAHRLSTIAAADKILVLKNGRVIEEGTHQSLAAIEDGYYASLIQASQIQAGREAGLLV